MDMNRLHYFSVLVRAGSITKASELLNISQPAVSKAIKTLEAELGKELIVPNGRGISITDYGYRLVEHCEPLLEKLSNLGELDQAPSGESPLRIATFEVFSTYFFTDVMTAHFTERNINLQERVPGEIEQDVLEHQADIGITYLPIPNPDLDILKITSIEMGVFGLSQFGDYKFEELPFIAPMTPVKGTPSKAKGLDGFPDDKIKRKIKHSAALLETALQWSSEGLGVGYYPRFVVEKYNQTRLSKYRLQQLPQLQSKLRKKFDVFLVKRKSDVENSDFKKIAKELRLLKSL